jgi:undecaprenyl-phosphate 4-deoxy-4-formamido-L-arabinose transferase
MVTSQSVSAVVPVYNSEPLLPTLVERLTAVLEETGHPYEVILVNDGSADASWSRIAELCAGDSHVRGLDLMRNYGQHNATLAGVRAAANDVIVTLDDDLQNPPEEIPKLLSKLAEGFDVVYGKPLQGNRGRARDAVTWLTKLALRIAIGSDIAVKVSGFRAFRAELRDAFASFDGPNPNIDVLLTWGTSRYAATPVAHHARAEGHSGYTVGSLATHALNVLTGFSTRPLRFASLVGVATMIFGVAVLAYVLSYYVVNSGDVPGFPFLASIIAIFSGAQLLSLGMIGEYLARMHTKIMDRPVYAIRAEMSPSSTRLRGVPSDLGDAAKRST